MSILQQRRSIVGFFVGALAGLLLVAAFGQRHWETPAQAATQSALERKVDNLQNNLKTMQTKLNKSVERIAELETALDEVLTGTTPVGDADKLDGLDSTDFVLASEGLTGRVELLEDFAAGILSGDVPAGDASALGGRAPEEYALASEVGPELSFGSGLSRSGDAISLDYDTLNANYLRLSGGDLTGSLTVSGDVVAGGAVQVGLSNGAATAATAGALRFDGTGLQVSDGTQWRTLAFE